MSVIVGLAALAALQLSNLLYVAAAIVAAIVISALIALRHRRPKSLESGIESFSRELRALAPEAADGAEARGRPPQPRMTSVAPRPRRPAATRGTSRRPHGEHYRNPPRSSLDDGEQGTSPGPPGSLDPGGPGGAEKEPTPTDG